MALAPRLFVEETANIFVDVYAPVLRCPSLPTASAATSILDKLFTMLELRAALRRMLLVLTEYLIRPYLAFFTKLWYFNWYNEVWTTSCVPPEFKKCLGNPGT